MSPDSNHGYPNDDFAKTADRVSSVSITVNVILSLFKLLAGLLANSSAMVSDAIHSASDVFSTIVVIIGIRLSAKAPDKEHPYGHERMECVAAMILAMVLFVTGLGIGMTALEHILSGDYKDLQAPGGLALVAAVLSVLLKEGMFWYTRFYARRIDSSALMADAWHHRSDALSSVGAFVGIAFAKAGYPIMDPVASLVIFLFICKAALDIFLESVEKMVDHSCDEKTEGEIRAFVLFNPDVKKIDRIKTRIFGNKIYVDLEIALDGNLTLTQAHEIAERIHKDMEAAMPKIKHIMIHVNPCKKEEN